MGRNEFIFKRFRIDQTGCAMKVGTDGVLLGAWCRVEREDKLLLDIGTGTGVIALILAQRTEQTAARIDAVEVDEPSCRRAAENVAASGWSDRISVHCASVQDFAAESRPHTYDHIVSNPPYFVESLLSPDPSRNLARHAGALQFADFVNVCLRLIRPGGRVSLILPPTEAARMTSLFGNAGWGVSRRTDVWSTPESGPKRILMEFVQGIAAPSEYSSLVIEDAGHGSFSSDYRELTGDFYLKF